MKKNRKMNNENYKPIINANGQIEYVRRKNNLSLFDYINYIFFAVFALTCLFPVVYQFLMSFASRADYLHMKLMIIPRHFNFEAYKSIIFKGGIVRAFGISVLLALVGTAYSLTLTCLGAYAFMRTDTPGLKYIFYLFIFTMFFGGGLIPFYYVCTSLFGVDNLIVLILPFGAGTFNIILLRNFFSQVPSSIIESVRLDGASEFRILFQFILPLSKASLATIILFTIVGRWDDWYWPMIFITERTDLYPMALKLRSVLTAQETEDPTQGVVDWTEIFAQGRNAAMVVVSLTPILCLYPFLQRYFTKGVLIGGVKG